MGTAVDQTMPALFAPSGTDEGTTPLAQLGAGPDGAAVLAKRGDRLVEIAELSFGPPSPQWTAFEARVRAIGAVEHAAVRAVLSQTPSPPTVVIEGDNHPPLAELVEQSSVDLARVVRIVLELPRAVGAAQRIGIAHGGLHPWSVHVGAGDRPNIELTGLETKPTYHAGPARAPHPSSASVRPSRRRTCSRSARCCSCSRRTPIATRAPTCSR